MSSKPTEISPETYKYIIDRFSCADSFMKELQTEALAAGIPQISISEDEGLFLQLLLKSINAKNVLEIGSLAGFSAIAMARALPRDGHLTAIELNPEYAAFIRRKADEAGLGNVIEVVNADAGEVLKVFNPSSTLDFVFLDANKPGYVSYFEALAPFVRTGGIIAADNALAFGHLADESPSYEPHNVEGIRRYLDYINNRKDFLSSVVTIADGLALSLKIA